MNSTAPIIHSTARRRFAAQATRWFCGSLIALLAPLSLLAWSDSVLVLARGWRWVALLLVALGMAGAARAFVRYCRRPSAKEAAAALDQAAPLSNGYVISTSREFCDCSPADAVEGALLKQLHAEAARLAAQARPVQPWPGALMVCAALASLLALLGIASKENGLALRRALQPWRLLPYTGIELVGPASAPARREPFTLTGKVTGRIPKELRLTWTGGRSANLPVNPDGSFSQTLTLGLLQDSAFLARAAVDGQSAPLRIVLRRVPKVVGYNFALTPPAYTRWPQTSEARPGFVVLRGTKAVLTLRVDLPAKSVRFISDNNQQPLALQSPANDGLTWQAELGTLARTLSYQIETSDDRGTYTQEEGAHMIVVEKDRPPVFDSLTDNAYQFDSETPPEAFTLNYRVSDDVGLSNVTINCATLEKQLGNPRWLNLRNHELTYSEPWSISMKELTKAGVKPMDMLIITVTATDNNTMDGPGVTTAEPIFVEMPMPLLANNDNREDTGAGGDGSTDGPQEVNPLVLQKEIHRQILRASLGLKTPTDQELTAREQEVVHHLEAMATTEAAVGFGQEYLQHLQQAGTAAQRAVAAFPTRPGGQGRYRATLAASAEALRHLLAAARIEAASPPASAEARSPSTQDGSQSLARYSLLSAHSKTQGLADLQTQRNQAIEKAAADIEELRRQQQNLDQQVANPDAAQPADASGLAASQDSLMPKTQDLIDALGGLGSGDAQVDPKQVAQALNDAKAYQAQVAQALRADNLAHAKEMGAKTEDSLRVAGLLAKSLLDRRVVQAVEAQLHAAGYESLIQDYSRRISYDE